MKKALMMILALLMMAALCACSTDVQTQTDTSPAQTPPQTVTPANPPPTATPNKVSVPFAASAATETVSDRVDAQYPQATAVRTLDALHDYYDANCDDYDLVANPDSQLMIGFTDVANVYDAAFFEENALVLVLVNGRNKSVRHRVTHVWTTDDTLHIDIDRIERSIYNAEQGLWYIIIEVPQSSLDGRDIDVSVSPGSRDAAGIPLFAPTLSSGGRTVEPYEAVLSEKTYDFETNSWTCIDHSIAPRVLIDYFPTLTVGDTLLENGGLPLRGRIGLWDMDLNIIDEPEVLSAALLYRHGAGEYYVSFDRKFESNTHEPGTPPTHTKTSMYFTKLIVPDCNTAGLAGQLASLGGFNWSSVTHAVVVAEANDERDRPPIDLHCQEDATLSLIAMLCTTPVVTVGQPVDAAPARGNVIDVHAGDDVLMTLYHTQDGFFIGTGGVCYAADAPPWLFDQLVLAATGRTR